MELPQKIKIGDVTIDLFKDKIFLASQHNSFKQIEATFAEIFTNPKLDIYEPEDLYKKIQRKILNEDESLT